MQPLTAYLKVVELILPIEFPYTESEGGAMGAQCTLCMFKDSLPSRHEGEGHIFANGITED